MSTVTHNLVHIIDDDRAARESVAALVRSRGIEATMYESAEDFLARFDRESAGCLVVDVRLSGMSGIELQTRLNQEEITLPVVIVSGFGDVHMAVNAMHNGALTFLEKPCHEQTLWETIANALEESNESHEEHLLKANIRRRLMTLTLQERQVLDKLMEGKANKNISKEMDLGLRTVELRRSTILKKMQASSLPELSRMVIAAESKQVTASRPSNRALESVGQPSG